MSVSRHAFAAGSIYFHPVTLTPLESSEFDNHFTRLLGLATPQPGFSNLTEEQFERCYLELFKEPSLFESGVGGATVTASYTISAWNIRGTSVKTSSLLGINYGGRPWIIPRFEFPTMEVFEQLRDCLEQARLCKLNPRHIKGRKS